MRWKARSEHGKFLWFEDDHSDEIHRRNAKRAVAATARFRSYYEQISGKMDLHPRECTVKRPSHIMRHTLVQQMKNAELMDTEIVEMFGWCASAIVGS